MEQHISIDIHVPKLLEWLISRRHCMADWQSHIVVVRAKINEAIQDMPENKEITNLLSGTYINYFHCLKIVEILKETEADSKNIFGRYSSKRMKDWQEVISLYKKNNIYLAEAAELLINIVKYEIPSIKRLLSKQQQLKIDYQKKEFDSLKSSNSSKTELNLFLKELGLASHMTDGFKTSLLNSAKQLYDMNNAVALQVKKILPAVEQYEAFINFTQNNQSVDLAFIKYIAEKGNTTVYEWQHGEAPEEIIIPILIAEEVVPDTAETSIDWCYTTMEENTTEAENEPEIPEKKTGENKKVAKGDSALSVLDNDIFRTTFTNQLLELQMFLKSRLHESTKEGQFDTIVESLPIITKMLTEVGELLNSLTNPTTQHYYNILYSPRYLDNIIQMIEQKQNSIERYIAIANLSKENSQEAVNETVALNKKGQIIVKKGRELLNEIAKEISQRYNGRKVNLMGGPTNII